MFQNFVSGSVRSAAIISGLSSLLHMSQLDNEHQADRLRGELLPGNSEVDEGKEARQRWIYPVITNGLSLSFLPCLKEFFLFSFITQFNF